MHALPLTKPVMLDFSLVKTPPDHGSVLVLPEPAALARATRDNHKVLGAAKKPFLNATLATYRRATREAMLGTDDALAVVIGHQPGPIHPGVWAKHVIAQRLAKAVDGTAIHLVVDCDAPRSTSLAVPRVEPNGLVVDQIALASVVPGVTFEHMKPLGADRVQEIGHALRDAMGNRYDASQMATFIQALSATGDPEDWVSQQIRARRAVEMKFGVSVDERRISDVWGGPLLADMMLHATEFASAYNASLHRYRSTYKIRGHQRPIPDLRFDSNRIELPIWTYRIDEPRCRLFVQSGTKEVTLFADDLAIGTVSHKAILDHGIMGTPLKALNPWQLRPRALALTLWARLMLADLFVHGIGGAKYDRITDGIIASYYELEPPAMGCVSATLHLNLPRRDTATESISVLRRRVRDWSYNPHRVVDRGVDFLTLLTERQLLVDRAGTLRTNDARNHEARRSLFLGIREVTRAMQALRPETGPQISRALAAAEHRHRQNAIGRGREYFFALQDQSGLETLLAALPQHDRFRV